MVFGNKVCLRSVRLFYDKGGKLLKEIDGINVQQVIKVGLMILYHWSVWGMWGKFLHTLTVLENIG